MDPSAAPSQPKTTRPRWACVCTKYNYGKPHTVSETTFYRHLERAGTDEERQKIRSAKALTIESGTLLLANDLPRGDTSSASQGPGPSNLTPSARRAATLRALIKRAREAAGPNPRAGKRKCARRREQGPVTEEPQREPASIPTTSLTPSNSSERESTTGVIANAE